MQYLRNKIVGIAAHDKFSITVERFGRMLESKNNTLAIKYKWAPKWVQQQAKDNLMISFSEMMSTTDIRKLISDQMLQVSLYNKVNSLLPSLYWCLYIRPEKKHLDFFYEWYGVECKGPTELQLILNEIARLTAKYKELFESDKDKPAPTPEEFHLSMLIIGIETVLGKPMHRNLKLYELEFYYNTAVQRSKKENNG